MPGRNLLNKTAAQSRKYWPHGLQSTLNASLPQCCQTLMRYVASFHRLLVLLVMWHIGCSLLNTNGEPCGVEDMLSHSSGVCVHHSRPHGPQLQSGPKHTAACSSAKV